MLPTQQGLPAAAAAEYAEVDVIAHRLMYYVAPKEGEENFELGEIN